MQKVFTLFLFILSSVSVFGQGSISGRVTDSKTGEGVVGANVVIQGTTQGAPTDIEGNFVINNVKEGTYVLQISSVMYKTHTVPNVMVETARRITIDIKVTEDVGELQEVVVQGARQTDTDFDLLRSIKESKVVVVGITAEQIGKTLDRDAAQVLRRVPGVTIRDNQFVQIRGLSERYNPVLLHNTFAPSVETDIRSFSFQTLPSSQLDRMLVFKSPSADLPGDFAGGIVKVFTKSIPEENGFVVDYSTQVRAGTTFQDFYRQSSDAMQFTGFNTGFYDLPASFPANVAVTRGDALVNAGRSLKNLWKPEKMMAIPDQRFTLTYNKRFRIGKIEVGNISALNYSNAFATFNIDRADYTSTPGGGTDQNFGFSDKQYNQQIRTGFLFNWAFKFDANSLIEFKNLYNQSSADQYVDRTGAGVSEGQKNGAFDKMYRGIYSGQLMGTHDLFNKQTTIEWVAGYNNANRSQPDYKRYTSTVVDKTTGKATVYVPNQVLPNQLGRFYSDLQESAVSGGVSIKQRFNFGGNPLKSPELKGGVYFEGKNRTFGARNIGYTLTSTYLDPALVFAPVDVLFQSQNINKTTGIQIGESTNRKDSYTASNDLFAFYFMGSLPIGDKFVLDAGVRQENNLQQLHSFDDFKNEPAEVHNQINRLLPSANLSYNFTDKMLVRAAYGETLNRPEFRELAPFSFYDFNFNFIYFGDKNLKTASIKNIDLRWEFYPSKGELITIGGFYKDFTNPIVSIVDANSPGGGVKNVTYTNGDYAKVYGVEVEIKKSLNGLTSSRILDNINLMFNATLIKSTLKIPDVYALNRSSEQPLQGQAPYVINTAIYYTSPNSGWQINALYNVVGKNIAFVGNNYYPDVYVMPRNIIDITFNKRLGERFDLKGGISDILNQPFQFLQDGNGDGKLDPDTDTNVMKFRPGQVFSIGFSYRF
ncbi:MAG TPA: TonB-dependent receptor [Cyclobacteriaceae bacterium]|nr:TonB-dependent receptor [Cyclobacteriaceae bacterium]